VAELGGPPTPAIGFAIGFDRLVEVLEQIEAPLEKPLDLFIVSLGDTAVEKAYLWSCELNRNNVRTELDFRGKSMKALMKRADKLKARYVLISGENELAQNTVLLRNMATTEQVSLTLDHLVLDLIKIIKK
jgi:histidyl-tRNA synthetase